MPIEWISVRDAASLRSVSEVRIKQLIYAGRIKARKLSGVWLVSRKSVEEWEPQKPCGRGEWAGHRN